MNFSIVPLFALILFIAHVNAFTIKDACVVQKFSCCPNIDFTVNVDLVKDGLEKRVCEEVAKFAASKENVSPECLKAQTDYICLKRIPRCANDNDRQVPQLCKSVCVNAKSICLAAVSKNPMYFDGLCKSDQTNPNACDPYPKIKK